MVDIISIFYFPCTHFHHWVLTANGLVIDLQWKLVELVDDDDNGRIAAKALNDPEPVVNAAFLLTSSSINDQKIKTAFSQEELVSGVVDLLPAEIPYVDTYYAVI